MVTDEGLLAPNLASYNQPLQLKDATSIHTLDLVIERHNSPLHTLMSRYLSKPSERQSQSNTYLPVNDSIYAFKHVFLSTYHRYLDGESALRVKRHHESNLIYRFIHTRHTASEFSPNSIF